MAKHRILLVDDQHEIRRMLRAGLETLGTDYQVTDVPSAEEAMLVISRHPIDLLICDIRLPGMTGLELKAKVQRRNPDLKVILITGLTDTKIRKQVADAGVDGFFTKPLVLADLLDAVERIVGEVQTFLPKESIARDEPVPAVPSLAEQLAVLRKSLNADAVLLLDDKAVVIAEAGSMKEIQSGTPLLTSLIATFNASAKASLELGMRMPEDLLFMKGGHFNLVLVHIGPAFGLLAAAHAGIDLLGQSSRLIFPAVGDLLKVLAKMGASAALPEIEKAPLAAPVLQAASALEAAEKVLEPQMQVPTKPTPEEELAQVQVSEEDIKEFESLFGTGVKKPSKAPDLDSFWETATQELDPNDVGNASAISYDQARKLGLAPDEKHK